MFKRKKPDENESNQYHPLIEEESHDTHDEGNWLISYADMMTLLCGFFIMLFSMAKLDVPKYDSFKEALAKQFGGEYTSVTKEMAFFATQLLQELGIEQNAIIKADASGVSIVFQSTVFFETLSAEVTPGGQTILNRVITGILEREKKTGKIYRIVVEGHTDARPILGGSYPTNWELSAARASRVVRMFLEHGFSPNRLTAIGYADTYPQVPSLHAKLPNGRWDETVLAKNRRVVLRIMEPGSDSVPVPEVPAPQVSPIPSPIPSSVPFTLASPVPSGKAQVTPSSAFPTAAPVGTANSAH